MGFKHAAVLAPTCFFLGVLSICFAVDYPLLWGDLTDEVAENGFRFYTTFYRSPPAIKALLHGMVSVGVFGLLFKLFKWDESAMFFDGSSMGCYLFAISVYTTVIVPTLQSVVDPPPDETREQTTQVMRVLAAANIIVGVCLAAVLTLQAGQEYARRQDEKVIAAAAKADATAAATATESQKTSGEKQPAKTTAAK